MLALWLVAGTVALLGHGIFWVGVINQLHAKALPLALLKAITFLLYVVLLGTPPVVGWWIAHRWASLGHPSQLPGPLGALVVYAALCLVLAAAHVPRWLSARLERARRVALVAHTTARHDICQRLGKRPIAGAAMGIWSRVPGNQLLTLEVHEKTLLVPRLPPELEGLSIAHLSDLHLKGHVTVDYFREVVALVNEMQADLAVVTGDICDSARAIDWIPQTLGHLSARFGKYYVLGNHDLRIRPIDRLRSALAGAGVEDVGGRCHSLEVHGQRILLAGNELPWWDAGAEMLPAPAADYARHGLRILLAHTPDHFHWAREHDFDLMLAGHTHGGQICLPLVGPVICPSRFGVKYASGTYYERPTVLHVSRGISSLTPVRFNCPTEVVKLVLTGRAPE